LDKDVQAEHDQDVLQVRWNKEDQM